MGQPHAPGLHAQPRQQLHSHCQSHGVTCAAPGLGSHRRLRSWPPDPARAPRGGHRDTISTCERVLGPRGMGSARRQRVSPAWPCLLPTPQPARAGRTPLSAAPRRRARLSARRGKQVPRGLFPASSRPSWRQQPRAAQGSPCDGSFPGSRDLSRGCGCLRDPGLPCWPGHPASRARWVMSPREAPHSSRHGATGRGTGAARMAQM